ncbi:MAG TPA: hypothetical protein VFT09_07995 [Ilumatobacteraceae bacterium]|nr:hypothetical protein [Ilumatobacteraceae bacterium]
MLANATQDWHHTVAIVLIVANAVAGAWALGAHFLPALRGWPLWVTIGIAQATTFAQAITGALLMTRYDIQPARLHALYGFSAIIAVGILYSYRTSPFMRGKQYLLYAGGSLFIMGLGLRELLSLS